MRGSFGHFESDDPDYIRRKVSDVFRSHKFWLLEGEVALRARMTWIRLSNIVLSRVRYGGNVGVEPGELLNFYALIIPIAGQAWFKWGAEEFQARSGLALIASPDRPLKMRLSKTADLVVIRIERAAVERALSGILGRNISGPMNFVPIMDLSEDLLARWWHGVKECMRYVDQPAARPSDGLMLAAEHFIITALLKAQQNDYTHLIEEEDLPASKRAAFKVIDMMRETPESGWKIKEYAIRANISVRALQKSFHDHLNTTPSRYLRKLRLERVHEELRKANPDSTAVRAVAEKWHFHHLDRFYAWYKELVGEWPPETLRRK